MEATPSATLELEQAALDLWRHELNHVRAHEALAGFHVGLHVFHDEPRLRFFELDLGTIDIPSLLPMSWRFARFSASC